MARVNDATPSNADLSKETTLLKQQGKLDATNKPIEWNNWRVGK